jgi:hypothetical protein
MNRYINHSRKNSDCSREAEIIGVCGDFGYLTKQQVHDDIKLGNWVYWSTAPGVSDALVHARGEGPNRYIQTEADGKAANNLVNLPDC